MALNKKLIHFKKREFFDRELANGNVLDTSICFIQDETLIYTHGTFYDGSTFDPSNIEESILNIQSKTDLLNIMAEDANEELDNVEADVYIKYVSQTLTDEQKAQARENIDCPSVSDIIEQLGETKKSISILFVGNSLTQDGIAYLPYMLKTYYPEVDFKLYMWYIGGYTLGQHYSTFTSGGYANIFSVAENTTSWTNYSKNKTMAWVLQNYTFDIVCMQEYFNYKTSYKEATDWNLCRDFIVSNYKGGNALEFISLFHAPLRKDGYDVNEIYKNTEEGNALILKTTISEDVIPNGIAVYRALDTDLNSLGDLGQLSPDGTHTQEGLPCLLQTYVTLCWLFDRLGINKSVYGHPMRMTTAIYNSINVPGANLGKGVVQGTDAQNLLAQEVAIKAYKEGKQFLMKNLYPFEWGSGGGSLMYGTFTIICDTPDVVIKINGIEQSSYTGIIGSSINWEVSKEGYYTQTGSEVISGEMIKEVSLSLIQALITLNAEFNQGLVTIFNEQGLEVLKPYLTVTALWADGTNSVVTDYILEGDLSESNVVTVRLDDITTTFNVDVTNIVIPEEYTRYGYIQYYKNTKPATSALKAPSNFIYLLPYEDMNQLSVEYNIGNKSNVTPIDGAGLCGARIAASEVGASYPWYGLYIWSKNINVDVRGSRFTLDYPKDTSKFNIKVINRRESPLTININNGEIVKDFTWNADKVDVIPLGMSLFNNIPNGTTSNMSFNFFTRIGEIIFRDYDGKCVGYYIPVTYDNKIGMYDVITNTFCTAETIAAVTVGNSACLYQVGNW